MHAGRNRPENADASASSLAGAKGPENRSLIRNVQPGPGTLSILDSSSLSCPLNRSYTPLTCISFTPLATVVIILASKDIRLSFLWFHGFSISFCSSFVFPCLLSTALCDAVVAPGLSRTSVVQCSHHNRPDDQTEDGQWRVASRRSFFVMRS